MVGRVFFAWLAVVSIAALFAISSAQAAVLAEDPFLSGVNPAAGEYAPGDLVPQNPTVSTFNAAWADGLTTTTIGTFDATATGLDWAGFDAVDGGVAYQYSTTLSNVQAAVRPFTNAATYADGVYYMAGLMSFDANFSTATTSMALTGLLNAEEGDTSVSYLLGSQWGFQGNGAGGVDAVFRARSTSGSTTTSVIAPNVSPGTHLFMVKVESDYTGTSNDRVSIWLDPIAGFSEDLTVGEALLVKDYGNMLDPTEPARTVQKVVLRATDVGADAVVGYDEVRMGEQWADVIPLATPSENTVYLKEGVDEYTHLASQIREGSTSQYGTNPEILVGNNAGPAKDFRTVLAFGVDDIPEDATITSVELSMTCLRTSVVSGTGDIELRLTDPSSDMAESVVTWTKINSTTDWTTGGGDPQTTVLSSIAQPTFANQTMTFQSTAALVAAVQDAVDGDGLLEMVMMAPLAESKGDLSSEKNFVGFHSDDATVAQLRPCLKITYAPIPEPGTLALLLAAVGTLLFERRNRRES